MSPKRYFGPSSRVKVMKKPRPSRSRSAVAEMTRTSAKPFLS